MPWPTPPCKDCGDRKLKCHSTCEAYKSFKSKLNDISKKRIESYELEKGARSKASYARKMHYKHA